MEQNGFFRFVTRFNSVAIMIIVSGIIIVGGYEILRGAINTRKPAEIKNVADDPGNTEKWRLGTSQNVDGTDYVYIPLESEKEDIDAKGLPLGAMAKSGYHSYGDAYFNKSRNILFIDNRTRQMGWLYPTNNQIINGMYLVSSDSAYGGKRIVKSIVYRVVSSDTDGDGKLSLKDSANIFVSRPNGANNKEAIKMVEELYGKYIVDDGTMLIIYQSNGSGHIATIDLDNNGVIKTSALPKI